ncbi:MAG: hypothetical protein SVU32_00725 [Candidatus Nanohaloarchaea archaeon]|nr:hypothetical protein [Candidatus Nanohaloarchaea archaeon]
MKNESRAFRHYCEEMDDLVEASLVVARERAQSGDGFLDVFRECLSGWCFEEFLDHYAPAAYESENRGLSGQLRVTAFKEDGLKPNRDHWIEFLRWEVSL